MKTLHILCSTVQQLNQWENGTGVRENIVQADLDLVECISDRERKSDSGIAMAIKFTYFDGRAKGEVAR